MKMVKKRMNWVVTNTVIRKMKRVEKEEEEMRTTEEKLRVVHKGCDNIIDELSGIFLTRYDDGRYDLAKEILDIIEEE